jgi:hypothetical protein
LYAHILSSKAGQKVATSLIKQKALVLAKNTTVYLQTQLAEVIKLNEPIVKMGTHRNQLNNAFKTRYGLTVFA